MIDNSPNIIALVLSLYNYSSTYEGYLSEVGIEIEHYLMLDKHPPRIEILEIQCKEAELEVECIRLLNKMNLHLILTI